MTLCIAIPLGAVIGFIYLAFRKIPTKDKTAQEISKESTGQTVLKVLLLAIGIQFAFLCIFVSSLIAIFLLG